MPHIVCISASNIRHAGTQSTSYKICKLIERMLYEIFPQEDLTCDIITLVDQELQPCNGCGGCYSNHHCAHDQVFNTLHERILRADGMFVVAAHYAPIPAKLCMLLEKMEQITFLPRFNQPDYRSPLYQHPVGIIAHGGGTADISEGYRGVVIHSIANALDWPIEMKLISPAEGEPLGVCLPIARVSNDSASIFPVQEYDWQDIRKRLTPLVQTTIAAIS